jgi:hypothetical protein
MNKEEYMVSLMQKVGIQAVNEAQQDGIITCDELAYIFISLGSCMIRGVNQVSPDLATVALGHALTRLLEETVSCGVAPPYQSITFTQVVQQSQTLQ